MGERGYLAGLLGMHYQGQYTNNRIASVAPEKWDLFHEMLLTDELSRAASGGFVWNVIGGFGIGCPPLVKFGKKPLVDRILPGILNGDKRICLAITEHLVRLLHHCSEDRKGWHERYLRAVD
jgi:alkylation response protein AidB-like acyl-CoA dehydrogenase